MPKRIVLDADGILVGFEDVEALADGDIDAGDCDLKPGMYRWDVERQTFLYIGGAAGRDDLSVQLPRMLALVLIAYTLRQPTLPEEVLVWLSKYGKTVDGRDLKPLIDRCLRQRPASIVGN